MQLFHPIVAKSSFNHQLHHNRPPNEITKHNQPSAHTPSSSLSNLAKITNVESSINNLAQLRVNKITAPGERSLRRPDSAQDDFSQKEKENGEDRAEKRRQSKQKKRKIRMNRRWIRKCLGDRRNMTFRSSITKEISSSRFLSSEGGALTIAIPIRRKRYPLFSLRFVHIQCIRIWKKSPGYYNRSFILFAMLSSGFNFWDEMIRFYALWINWIRRRIEDKRSSGQRSVKIKFENSWRV